LDCGCPKEFLLWIALDHSGLLGIGLDYSGLLRVGIGKANNFLPRISSDRLGLKSRIFTGARLALVEDVWRTENPLDYSRRKARETFSFVWLRLVSLDDGKPRKRQGNHNGQEAIPGGLSQVLI